MMHRILVYFKDVSKKKKKPQELIKLCLCIYDIYI